MKQFDRNNHPLLLKLALRERGRLFSVTAAMILFIFSHYNSNAQDIHFSQYYASPATLNPATTGNFDGTYRAGLNYRTQWGTFTIPWSTFDAYADMSFLKDKKKNSFFVGAGILIAKDVSGDGVLSVTKVLAGGALHYKINNKVRHTLSAGMQFGMIQKSIDWSKLYFDDQWVDGTFNKNVPSMENYAYSRITYPDMSVGALYQNSSNYKFNYYISLAEDHVLQPKESFYAIADDNTIGVRTIFSAGVSFLVSDNVSLSPSMEYMTQTQASETLAGVMLGYDMSDHSIQTTKVFIGIYDRFGDAFIPAAGIEYGPFKGFVSYDSNYSLLSTASNGFGAVEFSLVFVGGIPKYRTLIDIPCPRF